MAAEEKEKESGTIFPKVSKEAWKEEEEEDGARDEDGGGCCTSAGFKKVVSDLLKWSLVILILGLALALVAAYVGTSNTSAAEEESES